MFAAIHHIAILASDYARSKAFYVDKLGFEVIREVYRAERDSYKLDLALNGQYVIELFSFPHPPARLTRPEACGLRHLSFAVDDLDATVTQLLAAGITPEPIRIDEHTGKRFTFFPDPDGCPLEVYERE